MHKTNTTQQICQFPPYSTTRRPEANRHLLHVRSIIESARQTSPAGSADESLIVYLLSNLAKTGITDFDHLSDQSRHPCPISDRGIIFLDSHGRVIAANNNAFVFLQSQDISIRNHRPLDAPQIRKMLLTGTANRALLQKSPEKTAILVQIHHLDKPERNVHYILLLNSLDDSPLTDFSPLVDLYHLSNTEAELAIALANGLSVQEYAANRCREVNTVRSTLKRVFRKMAVTRQAELVGRIHRLYAKL